MAAAYLPFDYNDKQFETTSRQGTMQAGQLRAGRPRRRQFTTSGNDPPGLRTGITKRGRKTGDQAGSAPCTRAPPRIYCFFPFGAAPGEYAKASPHDALPLRPCGTADCGGRGSRTPPPPRWCMYVSDPAGAIPLPLFWFCTRTYVRQAGGGLRSPSPTPRPRMRLREVRAAFGVFVLPFPSPLSSLLCGCVRVGGGGGHVSILQAARWLGWADWLTVLFWSGHSTCFGASF